MTPDDTLVTIPNSKILDALSFNENAGVAECMVVMEVFLPADSDPDLVISIGREALLTCPYLRLDRRHAVSLRDGYSESPYLILRMKGYVYDHRYRRHQKDVFRDAERIPPPGPLEGGRQRARKDVKATGMLPPPIYSSCIRPPFEILVV